MRPGDLRGRARACSGLRHHLGRGPGPGRLRLLGGLVPLGRQFIEPPAQALGQPPRVREHDRGLVLLDQVEHPLLDVRPDRPPRRRILLVVAGAAPWHRVQLGHVLYRDHDPQLDALRAGRLYHGHRAGAAEERGHLLDRPHGRGKPDPLGGGCVPAQRVEALERQRQVGAALVAGDGVNLVHDDGLDPAQGLPGLRGEQQEQRFRCGDEDVRRLGGQLPAFLGGGVAGAHRDRDVRLV
jgi:hypothetical protein